LSKVIAQKYNAASQDKKRSPRWCDRIENRWEIIEHFLRTIFDWRLYRWMTKCKTGHAVFYTRSSSLPGSKITEIVRSYIHHDYIAKKNENKWKNIELHNFPLKVIKTIKKILLTTINESKPVCIFIFENSEMSPAQSWKKQKIAKIVSHHDFDASLQK
jgi:hypothetical protein